MFDIGWSELMVVAVIAIVVVGPKDLPRMLRTVGQAVGKMRRMARDFQRQLNDVARDAELDDLQRDLTKIGNDTSADIQRGMDVKVDLDADGNIVTPPVKPSPVTQSPVRPAAIPRPAVTTTTAAPVVTAPAMTGPSAPAPAPVAITPPQEAGAGS